ncbi:DUF4239 domain-containing protein [Microvirga makkahensis]|uniref:DUF4239 domain-containing protein n=1 Tax=Microvirga makkahensis TaxID=1128670 RepID=A0A7X3MU70_9HYPH|nr:DUF4239 domain-containing protein [Microvirga makkahensis]MXQ13304.1 DUF4239 domain-containing protein [Microvirga makkahensis]
MANLLQLPVWLGATMAMAVAVAASALPFVVVRRRLSDELPTKARDVAETVAVRIGAIHGLILALVFAEAQSTHTSLQREVAKETSTIEQIALQLKLWNGSEAGPLREQLAAYVGAVLQSEWQEPGRRPQGSSDVGRAYYDLDEGILDLRADTSRQQSLRSRLIANMDSLQDHRKERLALLHRGLPTLFWWMAIAGFLIIVGFFLVFPASALHAAILSIYGAYTGLTLYAILALSHPYAGPAIVDTTPYETALDEIKKAPKVAPTP